MDKVREEIEKCCQEIAYNVQKYNNGVYDYEHYVAIFEGNVNHIVSLCEDLSKCEMCEKVDCDCDRQY